MQYRQQIIIGLVTGFMVTLALFLVLTAIPAARVAVFVVALLLGSHHRPHLNGFVLGAFTGLAVGVMLLFGGNALQEAARNIAHPPAWDFKLFWTFGQASAQGLNPYDHDILVKLVQPLSPEPELLVELYFFHAPPTLFLFAPLGWFSPQPALLLWYLLNTLVLAFDIFLLWRLFPLAPSRLGLLLTAALVMVFYPTFLNIVYAQLNFLLLLAFLLFWRDRDQPRAGLWLAIGIFIKPIMLGLLLPILIRRRWPVLAATFMGITILILLAVIVYGGDMVFGYFTTNTIINHMPGYLYTEKINQSLLATILRLTNTNPALSPPLLNPIFIAVSLALAAATGWLIYRLDKMRMSLGLALTLALALLLFPKTLSHYSFLLLPCLFLLWSERDSLPGGAWPVVVLLTLIYTAVNFQAGVFFANTLIWMVLAVVCVLTLQHFSHRGRVFPPNRLGVAS